MPDETTPQQPQLHLVRPEDESPDEPTVQPQKPTERFCYFNVCFTLTSGESNDQINDRLRNLLRILPGIFSVGQSEVFEITNGQVSRWFRLLQPAQLQKPAMPAVQMGPDLP